MTYYTSRSVQIKTKHSLTEFLINTFLPFSILCSSRSVSYTHLDVYKRQNYYSDSDIYADFYAEFERDALISVFRAVVYVSWPRVCSVIFTMEKAVEQRICLKLCVSNKISCAEALKMKMLPMVSRTSRKRKRMNGIRYSKGAEKFRICRVPADFQRL